MPARYSITSEVVFSGWSIAETVLAALAVPLWLPLLLLACVLLPLLAAPLILVTIVLLAVTMPVWVTIMLGISLAGRDSLRNTVFFDLKAAAINYVAEKLYFNASTADGKELSAFLVNGGRCIGDVLPCVA